MGPLDKLCTNLEALCRDLCGRTRLCSRMHTQPMHAGAGANVNMGDKCPVVMIMIMKNSCEQGDASLAGKTRRLRCQRNTKRQLRMIMKRFMKPNCAAH